MIDGVSIYRHPLRSVATGKLAYVGEYAAASLWQFYLAWRVLLARGFDVIHACNPPDTIFLIALFFKLLVGTRFIFDHHDLSPELYTVKFGRRDLIYRMMNSRLLLPRLTKCSRPSIKPLVA